MTTDGDRSNKAPPSGRTRPPGWRWKGSP